MRALEATTHVTVGEVREAEAVRFLLDGLGVASIRDLKALVDLAFDVIDRAPAMLESTLAIKKAIGDVQRAAGCDGVLPGVPLS